MSENDNKLKKIHDQKLINSLLIATKEKSQQVLVWKFVGTKKVTAKIKITVFSRVTGTMAITPFPEDIENFKKIIGASETLNFYIPSGSTLFQCNIKHVENLERIVVYAPKFLAQLERRKWLRLKTLNYQNVRVQFSKKIDPVRTTQHFFRKDILDVGVGGMALIMTKAEARSFIQGEVIKGVELLIDDNKFVVEIQVTNCIELKPGQYDDHPYKVWKIGFRFAGMQKKDQEYISSFVFKNLGSSIAV